MSPPLQPTFRVACERDARARRSDGKCATHAHGGAVEGGCPRPKSCFASWNLPPNPHNIIYHFWILDIYTTCYLPRSLRYRTGRGAIGASAAIIASMATSPTSAGLPLASRRPLPQTMRRVRCKKPSRHRWKKQGRPPGVWASPRPRRPPHVSAFSRFISSGVSHELT
jgi:hypothetical protein